jgi:adenosine kinase
MLGLLKSCRAAGVPALVDPGKIIMDVDVKALLRAMEGADTLVLNNYERDLLVRQSGVSFEGIAASVGTVVITSGPDDITLRVGKKSTSIPTVKPQKVTDPSGAGDAFLAGYSYGRLKGLKPEWCTKIGSTAASFAVQATGTQGHRFATDAFYERLEHTYGMPGLDLSK